MYIRGLQRTARTQAQNYQHGALVCTIFEESRTFLALAYVACSWDAPLLGLRLASKQVAASFVRHEDAAVRRTFKIGRGQVQRWGICWEYGIGTSQAAPAPVS